VALITYSDVFSFFGTDASKQTAADQSRVTNEINRQVAMIESRIGRKIQPTYVSNVTLDYSKNCTIYGNKLFLADIYRDLYSITSLYENGVLLTESSEYEDDGDFYLSTLNGTITRVGQDWSLDQLAIKLSGNVGIGGASGPLESFNLYLIQAVGVTLGIWDTIIIYPDGSVGSQKVRSLPKETLRILDQYMQKVFI